MHLIHRITRLKYIFNQHSIINIKILFINYLFESSINQKKNDVEF